MEILLAWCQRSRGGARHSGAGPQDAKIAVERARIDENLVVRTFGKDALWAPEFVPGDALVFAGLTVHRTYLTAEMTERRLSVELRLA